MSLTFVGTTPHLAYHLRKLPDADATELWYLKSSDTGTTWGTPIAIPRNSSSATEFHSTRYYQALTIEPSGRVSVAALMAARRLSAPDALRRLNEANGSLHRALVRSESQRKQDVCESVSK